MTNPSRGETRDTPPAATGSEPDHPHDLWVFGYGSLMWRPDFAYEEAVLATLTGYTRAFCLYSHHHRGTPARPGLVLGLDRGGSCTGVAFRVHHALVEQTMRYLRARELISGVYREVLRPVDLHAGPRLAIGGNAASGEAPARHLLALTYVVERSHPQYTGQLPLARQAQIMRGATGISGVNLDYVVNTAAHLNELGIRERGIERLLHFIGPHLTRGRTPNDGTARRRAITRANRWRPCNLAEGPKRLPGRFKHRRCFAPR